MTITTKRCIIALLCLLLSACASSRYHSNDTTSLESLAYLSKQTAATGITVSQIRLQALQQTALTLGAQGALAWRSRCLNKITLRHSKVLDRIFNFGRLMLDHQVLPPVLVEANNTLTLDSPTAIRLSGKVYEIRQQAKFVTTAPNWRQYLLLNFKRPPLPDATLLPKNSTERRIWIKYIVMGWRQGEKQADDIYANNIARLKRDYNGMILYRQLLAQNIVSKPFVAQTNLGVNSDHHHLRLMINDRVLRITALPALNANINEWKPVIENAHGIKPKA